jgi:hypothetical protein
MRKLPMIDSLTKVKEKLDLLTVLKEIDIANNYFNMAVKDQVDSNIFKFYRRMKILLIFFINY